MDLIARIIADATSAVRGFSEAAQAADRFGDEAASDGAKAARALDRVGAEARQVGNSVNGLGRAIGAGIGALATFEAAKRVAAAGFNQMREAVAAYLETDSEAQESMGRTTRALADVRQSLGEAVSGGGALADILDVVGSVADDFGAAIRRNAGDIQELVRGAMAGLVLSAGRLYEWWQRLVQGAKILEVGLRELASFMMREGTPAYEANRAAIEEQTASFLRMEHQIEVIRETTDGYVATLRQQDSALRQMFALVARYIPLQDEEAASTARVTSARGASATAIDVEAEALRQLTAQKERDIYLSQKRAEQAAAALALEQEAQRVRDEAAAAEAERVAGKVEAQAEADAARHEEFVRRVQEEKDRRAELANAAEELDRRRGAVAASTANKLVAASERIAAADKERGAEAVRVIGEEMKAYALMVAGKASTKLFGPLAPIAVLELAAAAALYASGSALAGGGGQQLPTAASRGVEPVAPREPQRVETTSVVSNFGIVGDPREAARLVADMVTRAQREGYA